MDIAGKIDHTLLKPDATEDDIVNLCREAVRYGFASVCVNPTYLSTAACILDGTPVVPSTVIGFPLGATVTEVKVKEILVAKAHGAGEVDAVINIGRVKSADWEFVEREIQDMIEAARGCGLVTKIIIETGLLNEEEKQRAAEIVRKSGADYIKTSTGFFGGVTVEDVRKLKQWVGSKVKVKASGGIRTREFALELIKAGADRLGTSSGTELVNKLQG